MIGLCILCHLLYYIGYVVESSMALNLSIASLQKLCKTNPIISIGYSMRVR